MSENGELLYGDAEFGTAKFGEVFRSLQQEMNERSTYACGIRELEDGYYLLYISVSIIAEEVQYLGICRDLSEIYEDRGSLQNQYYLALTVLLIIGGICVYVMARVISRPMQGLSRVAERISSGNFELRSDYKASDEIGVLA